MEEISAKSRKLLTQKRKCMMTGSAITDLKKCSRVCLPKPMHEADEANLEIR